MRMAQCGWIAAGPHEGGFRAVALDGETVIARAVGAHEAEAFEALGVTGRKTMRIGEGAPDTVPYAVLPNGAAGLPALTQMQPPDVLGGWARLRIAGFLARHPDWDGVICLAEGGLSHWVHISAREVISFAGFLTPRLIGFLGGSDRPDAQAIADTLSRPERLAGQLRQAEISGHPDAMTGHLLGAELAATRVYWLGQQLVLIAPGGVASAHATAFATQSIPVAAYGPDDLADEGLAALARVSGRV